MSSYFREEIQDTLLQVPKASVRYLWHSNYWDGPLSGACIYNDERLWFICYAENEESDEDDTSWYRKFVLLRLSPEQWEEIDKRHDLFQDYVGTHCNYDENGKRAATPHDLKPRIESDHDKYYSWAKENPYENYSGEQIAIYYSPCDL